MTRNADTIILQCWELDINTGVSALVAKNRDVSEQKKKNISHVALMILNN